MQDIWLFSQIILHYGLHLLLPGLIAWFFFKSIWKKAWLIMISTMLVDLDHLFTSPIFDAARCSIGFHPFHSYYAIIVYFFLLFIPNIYIKLMALGLILHIITDFQDCIWISLLG